MKYELCQNYPNPFNPVTTIKYYLPKTSHVKLTVFDILGNEVIILIDGIKSSGVYEETWNASGVPSGIYFYQMNADGLLQTKKLIFIK